MASGEIASEAMKLILKGLKKHLFFSCTSDTILLLRTCFTATPLKSDAIALDSYLT